MLVLSEWIFSLSNGFDFAQVLLSETRMNLVTKVFAIKGESVLEMEDKNEMHSFVSRGHILEVTAEN